MVILRFICIEQTMHAYILYFAWIISTQQTTGSGSAVLPINSVRPNDVVDICVLVPFDDSRMFSSTRVLPAVNLAVSKVKDAGYTAGVKIRIRLGNSGCNSRDAPIMAFEYYRRQQVSYFVQQNMLCVHSSSEHNSIT